MPAEITVDSTQSKKKYMLSGALVACCFNFVSTSELCLTGDFDAQFSYIVQSQLMTDQEIEQKSQLIYELKTLLNSRWPGTTIEIIGSLANGLALKSSDVDCFASIPEYHAGHTDVILDVIQMLRSQPTVYQDVVPKIKDRVPRVTFFHKPTHSLCDLSFDGPTAISNTKLIKYYTFLSERVRLVSVFIKYWAKLHGIVRKRMLPSYGLYLLVVLYFQQVEMAPPISLLQRNTQSYYDNGWNTAFERLPYNISNAASTYDVLRGFFKYYSGFNFRDYIVSSYAGRPILKSEFDDTNTVPVEFALYRRCVREGSCTKAQLTADLWVQDAFEHNAYIGYNMDRVGPLLVSHTAYASKMFDVLPKGKVLRAILVRRQEDNAKKLAPVPGVSEREGCSNEA